jgi:hypothetical protein
LTAQAAPRGIRRRDLAFAAANYPQSFSYRHIRGAARRQVGEIRAAPASARIVAPRAIGRKAEEQIIEQDFRSKLHGKSHEPIRTRPIAEVAPEPDEHVWEVDEAPQQSIRSSVNVPSSDELKVVRHVAEGL